MNETVEEKNASSPIWRFFEANDGKKVKCLNCDYAFRNVPNSANLEDHLKRQHQVEHDKFLELMKNENEISEMTVSAIDIKYEEETNQNVLVMDVAIVDNSNEIQTTEDDSALENPENINSIETTQVQEQIVTDDKNREDSEAVVKTTDENYEEHDVQIVKIIPLPHARSEVWNYFGFVADNEGHILDRSKVVCKLCASTFCYSGNTTNFYSHLKSMHSEIQIRAVLTKSVRNSVKRLYARNDDEPAPNESSSMLAGRRSVPQDFEMMVEDTTAGAINDTEAVNMEDITHAIADFIVTDCRPLSIIQAKGFKRLLHLLAPGYMLPEKQKLTTVIRKRYDDFRKERETTPYQPST